jgi:hypothetical protein
MDDARHPPPGTPGGTPVIVEKRKWSGPPSARWPARLLRGEKGRMVLLTEAGARRERPRRGRVELARDDEVAASTGGWWIATRVGGRPEWKVDACTPLSAGPDGVVRFVDLDVDLRLGPGPRVAVADVLQGVRRATSWRYPPTYVLRALAGLADALARRVLGRWPFDGTLPAAPTRGSGGGPQSR